jgi:hypothetical protein
MIQRHAGLHVKLDRVPVDRTLEFSDWRGPLKVPVILFPPCLSIIVWLALPASLLAWTFQVPLTSAAVSAIATVHEIQISTASILRVFVCLTFVITSAFRREFLIFAPNGETS